MVLEISSDMLFEEHAVVFDQAVREIASEMNIPLEVVGLTHRKTLGADVFHWLHFKTKNGKRAGILIADDDVANIPQWPLPTSIIDSITSSLSVIVA